MKFFNESSGNFFASPLKIFFKRFYAVGEKRDNYIVCLVYAILSLLILFPLLIKPGYVFAPDMIPVPELRFPAVVNSFYPLCAFFWLLNFVLSSGLIQKVLMLFSLWLAGVGMHKLIPTKSEWPKYFAGIFYIFNPFVFSRFMYGQVFIIAAYAIMPFAIRAMLDFFRDISWKTTLKAGFWLVLIGIIDVRFVFFVGLFYAIAFLFYCFKYAKNPKLIGRLILFSLLIGAIFFVFNSYWIIPAVKGDGFATQLLSNFDWQHQWAFRTTADKDWGLFFNAGAMYGFWGDAQNRYLSNKEYAPWWPYLFMVLFGLVLWGIISSLISYFKRRRNNLKFADFACESQTSSDKIEHPAPSGVYPAQHVGGALVRDKIPDSIDYDLNPKPYTLNALIFVAVGLISYLLAIGVGAYCDLAADCSVACCKFLSLPSWLLPFRIFVGRALYHLTDFLNTHIPLFKGFREPQKFIGLLVLCYCYLGALGMDSILKKLTIFGHPTSEYSSEDKKVALNPKRYTLYAKILPAIFLLLPILYAPGMLWGFRGQLFNSQYPQAWFEVNEILNQDQDLAGRKWGGFTEGGKTLFLPWHQYLAVSFADQKVIANPAPDFFDKEVIAGDNMQMPGVLTTSTRPFSIFFENEIYPKMNEIKNLGELLAPWNVKYVMWAGESDFFNYLFVFNQEDLELVYKSERLILFKNLQWQWQKISK